MDVSASGERGVQHAAAGADDRWPVARSGERLVSVPAGVPSAFRDLNVP